MSETEREQYVLLKNKSGELYFKGKSLCISTEAVKRFHKTFDPLTKNFFKFVIEQNQSLRYQRERKNMQDRAHSLTTDQYTTMFKPKTKELVERSSAIKSQFLEMSKRKERPSSTKKAHPVRLIMKDAVDMLVKTVKIEQKVVGSEFMSPTRSD